MAELERCIGFLRELGERVARRTLTFPFGVVHLDDRVPRIWSRNYLVAETNLAGATSTLLAAEADRILGREGLIHRKVEVYDGEAGDRLAPGFRDLGWKAERDVVMVARREPDHPEDGGDVDEISVDELAPVWIESMGDDPSARLDDVSRQVVEHKRILAEAIPTRFFAARVDGEIASYCELYSDGQTGQIENVLTLERHRNRGLARATVLHALEASQAAGHDLSFLLADADDWPQELYRKLGFEEIGFIYDFLRAGPS
jgi:ribosomal protein S18 acetylase RimI-like enzyme